MNKSEAKLGVKVIATIQYPEEYSDELEKVVKYIPNSYGEGTLTGVIVGPAKAGKVLVKWDEKCYRDDIDGDEELVDLKVLSLDSDKKELEKEFKVVEKQIKEKVKEAAALVREANKMAEAAGARSLQYMYEAASPLVNAMDDSGWRSSSWGC